MNYEPMSDAELDDFIGIDSDGTVRPSVVILALADSVRSNIDLYALLTATVEDNPDVAPDNS